ncbi:MAG TPA: response regulator [Ramlibacter sp.]|nr:response regulator [Ramlibacter sp.]
MEPRGGMENRCQRDSSSQSDERAFVPQSRKVLIIEDEIIFAENLQAYFERRGWTARVAGTGRAAVAAASEFRPGMILLDYRLPDMTGFEVLQAIREVHCCSCVLMTAHPDHTVAEGAQRQGIARILTKPFALAGLESQLWETAAGYCAKCFENGRQPSRPDCGGFIPTKSPSVLGNFPSLV